MVGGQASSSPMPHADIRLLSPDDVQGASALSATAGWNQQEDDWRMLLALAPTGSFAAVAGGRIVGTAIGIDYGGFSWIAMMLVEPAYRGRGLGRRLLEAALDAVPADLPVRLDATPMGRPLYESFGFVPESDLTRYVAAAGRPPACAALETDAAEPLDVHSMDAGDLHAIAAADRQVFGGSRETVLRWAFERSPAYGHVVRSSAALEGYCFGRHGRLFDQIGPVVADTGAAARALLGAALRQAAGRAVVVDAFDEERGRFPAALAACGFEAQRPLFRMRKAPRQTARTGGRTGPALVEFAILGPEFA
jgi:GNAT superfamily N-acetyltransferase